MGKPDLIDGLVLLGFILFSIGLGMLSISVMLVVDGLILMAFGLFVARK